MVVHNIIHWPQTKKNIGAEFHCNHEFESAMLAVCLRLWHHETSFVSRQFENAWSGHETEIIYPTKKFFEVLQYPEGKNALGGLKN